MPIAPAEKMNGSDDTNGKPIEVGSQRSLCPDHLKELAASGISPEFAELAGLYSEHDVRTLARLAGYKKQKWPAKRGNALVIPVSDLDGQLLFSRLKPERPPMRGGKPAKYLQPSGVKSAAYFPPGFAELVEEVNEIVFTEGGKKTLCLGERGIATIGLAGVWNWKPGGKASKLLPELERFTWQDVTAFICFDSDAAENDHVRLAEQVLAATLQSRGAVVLIIRIPPAKDGGKQGIDDFIVAQGDNWKAEFAKLKSEATEPEPIDPGTLKQAIDDMDPASEADSMVSAMTKDGVSKLRFWKGDFWLWKRGSYSIRRSDEVRAELVNRLNENYIGVRSRHVSDVLEHLRAKTILSSAVESPSWLAGNGDDPPPQECVVLRNGLLHLLSLFIGKNYLTPATPRLLTTCACDYNFAIDAPKPVEWYAFLDSLWQGDQESIDCLQEIFGYLLTADTRQQKIFLFIGPTRSGKGAISRVLRRLVGTANVCGPTLAGLATNFGLQPLLGKSVGVVSDARLGGRTDASVVLERLLSISGEDAITVDMKFKESVTTKLPTRLVILSNELPRLADASSAITGRFLVLRMTQSFLGKEDRGLDAKLAAELPSIFLWACEGWRRLNERGYFQQPGSSLEMLSELRDLASPISAFVRDRCEVGAAYSVAVGELYGEWSGWCRSQGRDHTGTVQTFGHQLLAAVPTVKKTQPRADGKRIRVYEGIKTTASY